MHIWFHIKTQSILISSIISICLYQLFYHNDCLYAIVNENVHRNKFKINNKKGTKTRIYYISWIFFYLKVQHKRKLIQTFQVLFPVSGTQP